MAKSAQCGAVSKATVSRLPGYLRYLKEKKLEGAAFVTSTMLADGLRLNSVQVRKDLALVSSVSGRPKSGFVVADLVRDLEIFLGYDRLTKAVLVGVGGLGKALLAYGGFENYGLEIVASFDTDRALAGLKIDGHPVYETSAMTEYILTHGIRIGIITVPREAAQKVCDDLVAAGIKAVWNFAPVYLKTPPDVAAKNEDMAASLAVLSRHLTSSHHES